MQDTLASLIKAIGSSEIEIDRARHTIHSLTSGHYQKAFQLIDLNHSGIVPAAEICRFLKHYGVDTNQEEIEAVLNYYNSSDQKGLKVQDFVGAITPRGDNPSVKRLEDQELDLALARFFAREISLLRKTFQYRQQLVDSKIWTSFDSFKCIDTKGKGSFTQIDLDAFLQKNGVILSNADITAAFNRLDKENKQRVTFPDFQSNLLNETSIKGPLHSKTSSQRFMSRSPILKSHSIETPTFSQSERLSPLQEPVGRSSLRQASPTSYDAKNLYNEERRVSNISSRVAPHSSIDANIPFQTSPSHISNFKAEDNVRKDLYITSYPRVTSSFNQYSIQDKPVGYLEPAPYSYDPLSTSIKTSELSRTYMESKIPYSQPLPIPNRILDRPKNYIDPYSLDIFSSKDYNLESSKRYVEPTLPLSYSRDPQSLLISKDQGNYLYSQGIEKSTYEKNSPLKNFNVPPLSVPKSSIFGIGTDLAYSQPKYLPSQNVLPYTDSRAGSY